MSPYGTNSYCQMHLISYRYLKVGNLHQSWLSEDIFSKIPFLRKNLLFQKVIGLMKR